MDFRKRISLALSAALLGSSLTAFADGKEEVIYGVLNAQGQVDGLYAVNIFESGDVVDYGDYSAVHPLNTEDEITYENGEVRFHTDAQRVYYQGNLNTRDLPWLFRLTYRLDGQEIAAEELAGKSGHVEIELDIRRNPDYQGELFRSHALQITAFLDTENCRSIAAEGATQANVGADRQLSYIVLPNTEKTILISADATEFEMDAISINGVRLSLDIDMDDSELTEQTDKIVDAGKQLDDGAQELLDGASELAGHNEELLDGAQQLVDAVFETANDTLEASRGDFGKLGIELRTLTSANYAEEIARLQSELLENVDEYVRSQADEQLRALVEKAAREQVTEAVRQAALDEATRQVTEAAREQVTSQVLTGGRQQVRAQVEAAARRQVTSQVRSAAQQQVREQAEAQARQTIEAAIRSPSEETVSAQVERQMQSPEVQAEIDAAVEAQLATGEVQAQIDAQLTAAVRPQVEQAVEGEVRSQVEAAVRVQVRQQVSDQVEAEIRARVLEELTKPTAVPEANVLAAVRPASTWSWLMRLFQPHLASADSLTAEDQLEVIVRTRMESAEVQTQIDALTDEAMATDEVRTQFDAQVQAQIASEQVQTLIDSQTQQKVSDPALRAQAEDAIRQQIRPQVEAAARQKIRDAILNLSDDEVQALVEQQMQSDEVQAQLESAVAEQMASEQVQSMIAAEIENQMAGDAVRQKIEAETNAQLSSEDVQATLRSLIEQQMQSDEVQSLIAQNVEEQMATDEVQALIARSIDEQMASGEVRARIEQELETQRGSQEYLDSVAQALEENGENGEACRALSDLREKLDDVQAFYDGLLDYTDGVNDLWDGAQELKDGAGEFRSETANINDTISEKIDSMIVEKTGSGVPLSSFTDPRNTDVDSVQFVMTTPAIRVSAVHAEEAAQPESTGILEKIRNLFK